MFNLNKISISAASLALSALVSCVEMEEQQAGAVGYLAVPSLEVDVTVDDPAQTKALDFEIAAPAVSEVHFVVKDKDGNVKYDGEGLWADPLVLPVGAYTVEATAGQNGFDAPYFTGSASGSISPLGNEVPDLKLALGNALVCVSLDAGFAEHFTGEKVSMASGTVEKGFNDWFYVPSGSDLTLSLVGKNSAGNDVSFTHTLTAPAPKTAYSVVCKASSNNWPFISWTAAPLSDGAFEGGLYFKAAVASNMSDANAADMKYQIKGGEYSDWTDATVSDVEGYKYISGLSNGTTYTLRASVGNIFSEELPFSPVSYASCLSTDVTAAHNNSGNPSAMLENTSVSAAVRASLPAIVEELATSQTATLAFGNGRVKQMALNVNAAKQSLSNADGWPYLPQGNYPYTAEVSCTLPGGRTVTEGLSGSVTVPAPEFMLTVSAYTTYDRYSDHLNGVEGALAKANTLANRMLVEERKATLTISNAILQNENYKSLLTKSEVKYAGSALSTFSATTSNALTYDNVTAGALGTYDFTAAVTFDGVEKTSSHPCHITGLPYTADFTVSQDLTGWSLQHNQGGSHKCAYNTSKTDGYELAYGYTNKATCNMFSPEFMLPTSVNVGYSVNVSWWQTGLKVSNGDSVLHVGITSGTSVNSQKTMTLNEASESLTSSIESKGTLSNEDAVLANMQRVSIYVDSQDWGIVTEHFVVLNYFHIEYK